MVWWTGRQRPSSGFAVIYSKELPNQPWFSPLVAIEASPQRLCSLALHNAPILSFTGATGCHCLFQVCFCRHVEMSPETHSWVTQYKIWDLLSHKHQLAALEQQRNINESRQCQCLHPFYKLSYKQENHIWEDLIWGRKRQGNIFT